MALLGGSGELGLCFENELIVFRRGGGISSITKLMRSQGKLRRVCRIGGKSNEAFNYAILRSYVIISLNCFYCHGSENGDGIFINAMILSIGSVLIT